VLVKNEIISARVADVWISNDEILCVRIYENAEIEKEDVEELFSIYRRLGLGPIRIPQLMYGLKDFIISPAARARASELGHGYFVASAIISDSLATRFFVNFFIKFNNPKVPFKMFADETSAKQWLSQFQSVNKLH
jgi:hypothetical protein